ncbi:hypothetical protein GC163_20580 [bacterium]|nr:hypothetical protein [bacterium]
MHRSIVTGCLTLIMSVGGLSAAEPVGPAANALQKSRTKAIEFLKTSQAQDGTWTSPDAIGITALVTYALLSSDVKPDDPAVAKSLKKLESLARPDGSICTAKSRIPAYETAIAMMTLQAANSSGTYTPLLEKAEKFARGIQFDESQSLDRTDVRYGGAGYGPGGGRPDLSNTTFFLEALQAAGAKPDDPAVQKAVLFISRCQNLETEFNPQGSKVNDGGFSYTPVAGGNAPAGNTDEGGVRSYGSMTYAGFKSLLFAGVKTDDPRVQGAVKWIRQHYTVSENPGMGSNGLFYYYYLFAKSLNAWQQDTLEDASGQTHDWRKELAEHLFSIQQENGSWVNSQATRWFEGDPNLVTAYVLVALHYCDKSE